MSKVNEIGKRRGKAGGACGNPHCFNRGEKLDVQCKHKCGFVFYCSENCQK